MDVASEIDTNLHFAPNLIKHIQKYPGQEIGTHTFSHYYCLESGQTKKAFNADLTAAKLIAMKNGLSTKSLVFPRNQWNEAYLKSIADLGIQCYRGNESSWIYAATSDAKQGLFQRAMRLLDSYINLSGHHTYAYKNCIKVRPFCFPASRFLRPFSKKLAFFDGLRLRRIKKSMLYAAKNNQIFHLWWHPHNFGSNQEQNFNFLNEVLLYFSKLQQEYGMKSLNMSELAMLASNNSKQFEQVA